MAKQDNDIKPISEKGYTYKLSNLEEYKVQIEVEVKKDLYMEVYKLELAKLIQTAEIKGFRKGKAPESVVSSVYMYQLSESTLNSLVPKVTLDIITINKFELLDQVEYEIKSQEKDQEFTYLAKFTVVPELEVNKLKFDVKQSESEVSEKEIDNLFKQLIVDINKSSKKEQKEDDIDWAKELKDKELTSKALVTDRIKKNLEIKNAQEQEDKFLKNLIDSAISQLGIAAPKKIVEAEVKAKKNEYMSKFSKLKIDISEILKIQNTTMEDLESKWKENAIFQISSDLLFINVAKQNKLEIKIDEINSEIEKITDQKIKESYQNQSGRNYIASVILRQKSVEWLKSKSK